MSPNTPLRDPSAYFESHLEPLGVGLAVWAAHIVGVLLLFVGIMRLLLARTENIPSGATSALNNAMVQLGVLVVIIAAISLLVVAGIMHAMTRYGGGSGSFGDAVAVAGWSYAPDLLEAPVRFVWVWLELRGRTFDGSDPARLVAETEAIAEGTGAVELVLSLVVVGWSVYILAKGTATTHDVPLETAIWPAVIVGFGAFLFRMIG